jgi:hypothetical protein
MKKKIFIALGIIIVAVFTGAGIVAYKNLHGVGPKAGAAQGNTSEEILVSSVTSGQLVQTPIKLEGKAKGSWFFEGSFPVSLLGDDGSVLGYAALKALGNWQTADFVNFSGTLSFKLPKGTTGKLIFSKDNLSGLPENSKQFIIPVKFSKATSGPAGACAPDLASCHGNPKLCMEKNLNLACN